MIEVLYLTTATNKLSLNEMFREYLEQISKSKEEDKDAVLHANRTERFFSSFMGNFMVNLNENKANRMIEMKFSNNQTYKISRLHK